MDTDLASCDLLSERLSARRSIIRRRDFGRLANHLHCYPEERVAILREVCRRNEWPAACAVLLDSMEVLERAQAATAILAETTDLQVTLRLLAAGGVPSPRAPEGRKPAVHLALDHRDPALPRLLLAYPLVNLEERWNGISPLDHAIQNQNMEAIGQLLTAGCNVRQRGVDPSWRPPLILAVGDETPNLLPFMSVPILIYQWRRDCARCKQCDQCVGKIRCAACRPAPACLGPRKCNVYRLRVSNLGLDASYAFGTLEEGEVAFRQARDAYLSLVRQHQREQVGRPDFQNLSEEISPDLLPRNLLRPVQLVRDPLLSMMAARRDRSRRVGILKRLQVRWDGTRDCYVLCSGGSRAP